MFHSSSGDLSMLIFFPPAFVLMDDKVYIVFSVLSSNLFSACVGDAVCDLMVVIDAGDLGLTFPEDDGPRVHYKVILL